MKDIIKIINKRVIAGLTCHLIIVLMAAAVFSSCEDFLESKPRNFIDPDDFYFDNASVEAGLMGIYQPLTGRFWPTNEFGGTIYGSSALTFHLAVSDLEYYRRAVVSDFAGIFNFQSSNIFVLEYWAGCYFGISRANSFIDRMEHANLPGVNERLIEAAVGEAYFLRGFYYWHLAANWGSVDRGGVPLLTAYEKEINPHRERAPLKDVYGQILSDMKKAEEMVYETGEFNHSARVTQTTVQAMLARVCLYMAGEPLNDKSKYGEAAEWARKVVQSGLHTLNPDYLNVFRRLLNNEYDTDFREMMWEAEMKGVFGDDWPNTEGTLGKLNGLYCGDESFGYAFPAMFVSRVLDDYYLEDGANNLNVNPRYYWNVPTFDYGTGSVASTNPTRSRGIELRSIGKYRVTESNSPGTVKSRFQSEVNFPIMRYADVLLMLAEAINETEGPTDEAVEALNLVRKRANVRNVANTDEEGFIVLTDRDEFREFIKKERARELCFEATRRLDLIRWGQLVENVQYMSSISTQLNARRAGNNITEKHNRLPIPSTEMNSNSLMRQNQGW